ncbi:unnamed protein product [Rhodiola kirilowii]
MPYPVVVSPFLSILLGNLNDIVVHHVMLAWNMEKEHEELKGSVQLINSVVADAERKQMNNEQVKIWLVSLRDVADDAVDLFDEIITYGLEKKLMPGNRWFKLKMGKKLKKIRDRLDAAVKNRSLLLSVEAPETKLVRPATSIQNPCTVYGSARVDEKEKILHDLVTGLSTLSIFAVCGMGGIGKTTLVQQIYNDPYIVDRFNPMMWVSVPEDFDLFRMTSAMLECISSTRTDKVQNKELQSLQTSLQTELKGKQFLLVLDDVWNEDTEKWKPLMSMLHGGAQGSKVIMTMRAEKVAHSIGPLYLKKLEVFHVKELSKGESWKLFKDYAFENQKPEDQINSEMVSLSEEMLRKCHGVPLAIITLGSMIRRKQGLGTWKSIIENISWDDGETDSSIMPILRLSYFHLPLHLRPCFTYCSIFPKALVYQKEKLIQMWISNGFIVTKDDEDLYGKAGEVFQELVQRSFFQLVDIWYDGDVRYKIHDLMHDLASSIMVQRESRIPADKVRHLFLNDSILNIKTGSFGSLRSLIISKQLDIPAHSLSSFIEREKHLRVLDLSRYTVEKLKLFPEAIAKLKHLRYLNMSFSAIESLPESVGFLLNLKSLILYYCYRLQKLPNSVTHLENLLCLDIRNCRLLTSLPPGIGKLKNLRMLGKYIVGEGIGYGISELSGMDLHGELSIEDLHKVTDAKDVEKLNIGSKKSLHSLHLSWKKVPESGTGSEMRNQMMERVLDGLCPSENLKILSLRLYQGSRFPEWMSRSHLKLTRITLEDVDNCKSLPSLWKLPFLEELVIRGMKKVECFFKTDYDVTMTLFPALKWLEITSMPNFKRWTATGLDRIVFPEVFQLSVSQCNQLVLLPSCPKLEFLDIKSLPSMKLEPLPESNSLLEFSLCGFSSDVFPSGYICRLKRLEKLQFKGLRNVPCLNSLSSELECLSNLRFLDIECCHKLRSLPDGLNNLTVLETLNIGCIPNLTSIPVGIFPRLSSLWTLSIRECVRLTSLTDEIGCLKALEVLRIEKCDALTTLPTDCLQQLSHLWKLEICYCKGLEKSNYTRWLQCLPSLSSLSIASCFDLTSLLDTIAEMSKLDWLHMRGFSDLEIRCKKDNGRDWKKISHVPNIQINFRWIQGSYSY